MCYLLQKNSMKPNFYIHNLNGLQKQHLWQHIPTTLKIIIMMQNMSLIDFLKVYPNEKNIPYAHYLLGMVYYEKIVDEKKDLGPLVMAEEKFKFIEKKYPNTDFSFRLII